METGVTLFLEDNFQTGAIINNATVVIDNALAPFGNCHRRTESLQSILELTWYRLSYDFLSLRA